MKSVRTEFPASKITFISIVTQSEDAVESSLRREGDARSGSLRPRVPDQPHEHTPVRHLCNPQSTERVAPPPPRPLTGGYKPGGREVK